MTRIERLQAAMRRLLAESLAAQNVHAPTEIYRIGHQMVDGEPMPLSPEQSAHYNRLLAHSMRETEAPTPKIEDVSCHQCGAPFDPRSWIVCVPRGSADGAARTFCSPECATEGGCWIR